jgi:hypothetical protein
VKIEIVWILSIFIIGCGSSPSKNNSAELTQNQSIPQNQNNISLPRRDFQINYFEGDGGNGIRFAVLPLTGKDIPKNEQWILPYIEGNLASDFSKHSAITVLDRQNIEKIIQTQQEGLNGIFSDETQSRIGYMINSEYNLYGSIEKLSSDNYLIEFSISNTNSGVRKASYPPKLCTINEIQGLSVIKEISEDLLFQMGVILTEEGIASLRSSVQPVTINADMALSKGIVAQRDGTIVEAMNYYYDAIVYNPQLNEANGRLSALSLDITSGNIGQNVRNDIQRRNAWKVILDECEIFYKEHIPYEIIINQALSQGRIDYQKETVNLSCSVDIKPTVGFNVIQDVLTGLVSTGKQNEWGFGLWPMKSRIFTNGSNMGLGWGVIGANKKIDIILELVNSKGDIISTCKISPFVSVIFSQNSTEDIIKYRHYYNFKHIDTRSIKASVEFRDVKANDITDEMGIKIISVDGISIETVMYNNYIKITTAD